MLTAIDSSIILDVITDDPKWADSSQALLRRASQEGSLIICACVLAEIRPALSEADLLELLIDWSIQFVPMSKQSSLKAGEYMNQYLRQGGIRKRVVADFLVGAHAHIHADRLATRDRGFFRNYFKDMTVLTVA